MKVIKETADSSCMVVAANTYTQITAGPNSITTTKESGNYINGPLSISSSIENIKVSGMFKFNPQLNTGLASTLITPIPVLVFDLPVKNLATSSAISSIILGVL